MKIEEYLRKLGFNVGREGIWWKRFTQSERFTDDEKVNHNLQEIQRKLENTDDVELKKVVEENLNDILRSQKSDENNFENEKFSTLVEVSDPRSKEAEYHRNLLS